NPSTTCVAVEAAKGCRIVRLPGGEIVREFESEDVGFPLAVSSDGLWLAADGGMGYRVWNTSTGRLATEFATGGFMAYSDAEFVCFDDTSSKLAINGWLACAGQ